jgi:hypothetical protein
VHGGHGRWRDRAGTGAAQAQTASRAAPQSPVVVTPIAVNTANWSSSAGFGSTAPSWFMDSFGLVHLQGAAKLVFSSGPLANLLGTLPPAARPARDVYVIVHTLAGTYADLSIAPSGQVRVIDPAPPMGKDYAFVSLEGVTYLP